MGRSLVLYIHGKDGSPEEAKHYQPLFSDSDVIGLDYSSQFPWEAEEEFPRLFDEMCGQRESVTVIANSIGAYFAMTALADKNIGKAYFISPVADMQKLIENMMRWAGVSEDELREKGVIETTFGQTLSWEYLCYAKKQNISWKVPTCILYGSSDGLTSPTVIAEFAEKIGAALTVMENGEHWFHTEEQMRFLDNWIESNK